MTLVETRAFNILPKGKSPTTFQAVQRACAPPGAAAADAAAGGARRRGRTGVSTYTKRRPRPGALSASKADGHASSRTVDHDGDVPAPLRRIDVTGLSRAQVADLVDFSRPCILTGVLSLPDCEAWCEGLLQDLGGETCSFQIRDNESGRSEVFEASLMDFVQGLQDESTHNESWYLLDEHLLDFPQARPELGALLEKPQDLLGTDEFQLFPPSVRPQNLCTIVGGVGARSFLHSDPMEWMGWNILLEGRKLWTFLPPLADLDSSLGTYRLAPNAFGSHNVSAGWQSNVDLYQREASTASWPTAGEGQEVMQHAVSGVQEAGELVLIPPRHWHQVYHLEPSLAVASQYMDYRVRDRVFRHMLDWCGASDDVLLSSRFDALALSDQIKEVLTVALVARHGREKGLEAFDGLDDPCP
ncbi:unnamed protein product [Ectocarpus fasciculatus]